MAGQLEQSRARGTVHKLDHFVEARIAQTADRVRRYDLFRRLLCLGTAATLGTLTLLCLDLALELSSLTRVALLVGGTAAGLTYLAFALLSYFGQRINPFYAARQLEKTVPDAKESLVNWLDLRDQPLPSAIRASLGTRAARDVHRADLDEAVSPRGLAWLSGGLALAFVPLVVLFLSSPGQFRSLLARAFLPFREIAIASRTEIRLLEPANGDAAIRENEGVTVRAELSGRVPAVNDPDAPRLHYRYNPADPFATRPLAPLPSGEWAAKLLPDQILGGGVYYKVTAGDAATPEYRVRVLAPPRAASVAITYRPRPYRGVLPYTVRFPDGDRLVPEIREYEGTEVVLRLTASRPLRSGDLELDLGEGPLPLSGEMPAGRPETLVFQFTLRQGGTFRVRCVSRDGEANVDTVAYPLEVLKDEAPRVVLERPGRDVQAPPNGVVTLAGRATDDVGVRSLTLHLDLLKGGQRAALAPLPYRAGKSFRLSTGAYPTELAYKEVLELDKLRLAGGAPAQLAPGMTVEYRLEAADNCDYPLPDGHVGRSKTYKVVIGAPEKDKKGLERKLQQARREKEDHEQQQDEELREQDEEANAQRQSQENQQGGDGDGPQDQSGAGGQGDGSSGEDFQKKLDDLQKALDQSGQNNPGDQSGDQQQPGQVKDDGSGQQKNQNQGPPDNSQKEPGEQQPGEGNKQERPGANKNAGNQGEPKSDGKDMGGQDGAAPPGQNKEQKQDGGSGAEPKGDNQQPQDPSGANKQPKDQQPSAGGNQPQNKGDQQSGTGGGQASTPKEQPSEGMSQVKDGGDNVKDGQKGESGAKPGERQDGGTGQGAEKSSVPASKDQPDGQKQPNAQRAGGQPEGKPTGEKSGDRQADNPARAKGVPPAGEGQAQERPAEGAPQQDPVTKKDDTPEGGEPGQPGQKSDSGHPAPMGKAKGQHPPEPADRQAPSPDEKDSTERVTELERALKDGEPSTRTEAIRELERIGKEAKDPQVRDAARDAVKNARGLDGNGGRGAGEGNNESPRSAEDGQGPKGKGNSGKGNGQEPPGPEGAQADPSEPPVPGGQGQGTAQGQQQPKPPGDKGTKKDEPPTREGPSGTSGRRTGSDGDEENPQPANEEFSKRAGELQLEELRKKLTPDVLQKLNWSKEDAERFLRQARQYRPGAVSRTQSDPLSRPGSAASQLPGFGPRQVRSGRPDDTRPLDSGRVLPPSEFAPAYRRLTAEADAPSP